MKKTKKTVFALLFGLCVFALVGICQVKAINNVNVICVPDAIEKGEQSTCYVVGNGDKNIYGLYMKAAIKDLTIVSYGSNQAIQSPTYLTAGEIGEGSPITDTNAAGQARTLFDCNLTTAGLAQTYKDAGYSQPNKCYYLQSKGVQGTSRNHINPKDFVSTTGSGTLINESKAGKQKVGGYTEFAHFVVKLSDTATEKNCGTLCLDVTVWDDYEVSSNSSATANSSQDTTKFPVGYTCGEITPKTNPETGNFVSYIVLAAGAVVAIAVIAISTRNKKLYKI